MDLFMPIKDEYKDPALAARWENIIKVRREVTKALEIARRNKEIGHSLDASVTLGLPGELMGQLEPYLDQLNFIFIVPLIRINQEEITNW